MNYLIINNYKQIIYFYLLPKGQNDHLFINIPLIILEPISKWIEEKSIKNIYLSIGTSKYTFIESFADKHIIKINRYNLESRDIFIKFKMMSRGVINSISKTETKKCT
ncbi:MAG: hypothetical protein M0P71_13775 [Melioribacteraceae bacterium]|nr:hypothetical protein [Melioribacteraceae bacterium]